MAWVKGFKGIVAVANIRGGGEYGDTWHEAGIKEKRQNCFDDFQAAAKHLKQSKWAGPIVSSGGSNGGALVAACANQAPELFDAMVSRRCYRHTIPMIMCSYTNSQIPEVGVLDMLRYHNFTIGFLWASECVNGVFCSLTASVLIWTSLYQATDVPMRTVSIIFTSGARFTTFPPTIANIQPRSFVPANTTIGYRQARIRSNTQLHCSMPYLRTLRVSCYDDRSPSSGLIKCEFEFSSSPASGIEGRTRCW